MVRDKWAGPAGQTGGGMPVEGGSSGGGSGSSALAARHPKQKRKAHSLSIRRTNSTEERQPLGILRGDMLEGQVSLGTRFSPFFSCRQRTQQP